MFQMLCFLTKQFVAILTVRGFIETQNFASLQ